jgi:hypothetical protein
MREAEGLSRLHNTITDWPDSGHRGNEICFEIQQSNGIARTEPVRTEVVASQTAIEPEDANNAPPQATAASA